VGYRLREWRYGCRDKGEAILIRSSGWLPPGHVSRYGTSLYRGIIATTKARRIDDQYPIVKLHKFMALNERNVLAHFGR
jgi:hypothetical protein